MHRMIRATVPLLIALALAACGGGGGQGGSSGSGGTVTNSEGSWLSFTPNPIEVSGYEGESVSFKITATSSRTFSKPFNVAIVDTSGTITTDVQVSAQNEMTYVASLNTSTKLPAGITQAQLEVRLCEDVPQTCAKPLPGSPWRVPLKVNIKSKAEAAQRLSLSVPSLKAETYPGEKVTLSFLGQYRSDLQGKAFQVGVFDTANLGKVSITSTSSRAFTAELTTSESLSQGEYSGSVEVRLCYDDPSICRQPVSGSPWLLPTMVSVKSPVNLKPLLAMPALGPWSSFMGNAAHSGFVDASFNVANFTRRFNVPATQIYWNPANSAAIENGKVFMIPGSAIGDPRELTAISEADGTVAWRASLDSGVHVNAPAAGNGQVYVTTIGPQSWFWIFDQQSGKLLSKTPMTSAGNTMVYGYRAPTVLGTNVYSSDSMPQGVSKFSASTLGKLWSSDVPQVSAITPAVDANFVYDYKDGKLRALNVGDGKLNWEATDPDYGSSGSGSTVALAGKYAIVVYGGRLMAFDTVLRTRAWSVENHFYGQPAVSNDRVYARGFLGGLEGRSIADGKLQWTSKNLTASENYGLLVTRNLAFVSGSQKTEAIDLTTQEVVWSYPRGGDLSISSNGVLYILTGIGELIAINLQ